MRLCSYSREKRIWAPWCPSVCNSLPLPLDVFQWNLILRTLIKICLETSNLFKIRQIFRFYSCWQVKLIILQRAKQSTRSITHLCWCNWRTFWRKKAFGKVTKGVSFLHDNVPAHRALATRKKLACLGFQCLDHPPYSPDLTPSD